MKLNEHWKQIPNFENYWVSDKGEVLNIKKNKLLKPSKNKTLGYLVVNLGRGNTRYVHRLVAECFIPKTYEDLQLHRDFIDHINGIKDDNRLENLRWCTNEENCNFSLARLNNQKSHIGVKHSEEHTDKISKSLTGKKYIRKPILQYTLDGELIHRYPSLRKAALATGFYMMTISDCCKGAKETYMGYIWKYEEE